MNISEIVIGERVRKEMGNLLSLAESIKTEGLLQPIGVTEGRTLVFGERRLKACRDILGWTEIPARVVKVTSIIAGEYAENTVRKDFTPSERVAIADAVRRELGERRGNPDLKPNLPPVTELAGRTTRAIAAERSGFGSASTLNNAEKVVTDGVPELVQSMDDGQVSIRAAASIATLTPESQRSVLKAGSQTVRETARKLRPEYHGPLKRLPQKVPSKQFVQVIEGLAMSAENLSELVGKLNGSAPDHRGAWATSLRQTRTVLSQVIKQLEDA